MSKEFNDLSDVVLSYWFPMGKSSRASAQQEDHVVKEAWEGQGPSE